MDNQRNTENREILVTAAQVRARFGGISDMSLWRWLHDPKLKFPQPIVIQKRRYWAENDIVQWQANQFVRPATAFNNASES